MRLLEPWSILRVARFQATEYYGSNMQSNPSIRPVDLRLLDHVFEMTGGFVLDFTNATFQAFFVSEIGVDIDNPVYALDGSSKAKRLRRFLLQADRGLALKTLEALWEYRTVVKSMDSSDDLSEQAKDSFVALLRRLGKNVESESISQVATQRVDSAGYEELSALFAGLCGLPPQPRGYAFEKFLNKIFMAFGLLPRPSFKLRGEQIDGSFSLDSQTYLLEAKWTNSKVDVGGLRSFNAKVEDKAKWSRGLLVSYSGFSDDGLFAFSKGKSLVCMDGLDLHEVMDRRIDFVQVIDAKARMVAETGMPFVRVRDLGL